MLISWEGERDTSGQREGGEGAGEGEACGCSSLNTGALSHLPFRSDQQSCMKPDLSLASGFPGVSGTAGSRCSDSVAGLFSISDLCFSPGCPVWYPDSQATSSSQLTLHHPVIGSLLSPLNQSPSHWDRGVKHSDWPGLGHSLHPPLDSVSREHLTWGLRGGGFPKRKPACFYQKTGGHGLNNGNNSAHHKTS